MHKKRPKLIWFNLGYTWLAENNVFIARFGIAVAHIDAFLVLQILHILLYNCLNSYD